MLSLEIRVLVPVSSCTGVLVQSYEIPAISFVVLWPFCPQCQGEGGAVEAVQKGH